MMKIHTTLGLCLLALAACTEQGPAERAGEALDEAAANVSDAAQDLRNEAEESSDELSEEVDGAR